MTVDIKELNSSPHLIDFLIQVEDVLDSLDLYVFPYWIDGEIIKGPSIKRYWVSVVLRFEKEKCPDPKGATRLIKHGVRVDFSEVTLCPEDEDDDHQSQNASINSDAASDEEEDEAPKSEWHVTLSFPRRLIGMFSVDGMSLYDEEVDMDDVVDGRDEGIDSETAYEDDGEEGENSEFGNENSF